jgi:hypothetical protein
VSGSPCKPDVVVGGKSDRRKDDDSRKEWDVIIMLAETNEHISCERRVNRNEMD